MRVSQVLFQHYNPVFWGAYDMFIYPRQLRSPPSLTISGKAGCVEIIYDPENEYEPGQIVCPKDLKAKEEKRCSGWGEVKCTLEGIGEVLVESWDSVAYFYNLTKELIVEGITKILPSAVGGIRVGGAESEELLMQRLPTSPDCLLNCPIQRRFILKI